MTNIKDLFSGIIKLREFNDTDISYDKKANKTKVNLSYNSKKNIDDNIEVDNNQILLDFDPDFKLDLFYHQIYDIYTKIAEHYSNDTIRDVSSLMTNDLFKKNIRQLDSFRKRNLRHIVKVDDYLKCSIMDVRVVDEEVFVKVELELSCYDYIIRNINQKIYQGVSDKPLHCIYHLVLKKKAKSNRVTSNPLTDQLLGPTFDSQKENNEKWVLVDNNIAHRRSYK